MPLIHQIRPCNNCILLTKENWDSYEVSWEFEKNEIIRNSCSNSIDRIIVQLVNKNKDNIKSIRHSEIELNRIFNKIYSVNDEIEEG